MRALSATTKVAVGGTSTISSSFLSLARSAAEAATLSTSAQASNGSGRISSRPASPLARVSMSRRCVLSRSDERRMRPISSSSASAVGPRRIDRTSRAETMP